MTRKKELTNSPLWERKTDDLEGKEETKYLPSWGWRFFEAFLQIKIKLVNFPSQITARLLSLCSAKFDTSLQPREPFSESHNWRKAQALLSGMAGYMPVLLVHAVCWRQSLQSPLFVGTHGRRAPVSSRGCHNYQEKVSWKHRSGTASAAWQINGALPFQSRKGGIFTCLPYKNIMFRNEYYRRTSRLLLRSLLLSAMCLQYTSTCN